MLNSSSSSKATVNNNIKFDAVSGTLFKSNPKSFMKSFHLKSDFANRLYSEEPHINTKLSRDNYTKSYPIVVLQTMLVGDMYVIAEIMFKDDYEEMLGASDE